LGFTVDYQRITSASWMDPS